MNKKNISINKRQKNINRRKRGNRREKNVCSLRNNRHHKIYQSTMIVCEYTQTHTETG